MEPQAISKFCEERGWPLLSTLLLCLCRRDRENNNKNSHTHQSCYKYNRSLNEKHVRRSSTITKAVFMVTLLSVVKILSRTNSWYNLHKETKNEKKNQHEISKTKHLVIRNVATDIWRSLGCRTTPLEHWSKRKPTVEPRWAKQQTKKLRPKPTKINSFMSGPSLSLTPDPPACN